MYHQIHRWLVLLRLHSIDIWTNGYGGKDGTKRVAILGPTDISYLISLYGLIHAGYAVLMLSPRIAAKAIASLMSQTHCGTLYHADLPSIARIVEEVKVEMPIHSLPLAQRKDYDKPDSVEFPVARDIDRLKEVNRKVIIMHSSGSTGTPKPIYLTHNRYNPMYPKGPGTKDFMTLPLLVARVHFSMKAVC